MADIPLGSVPTSIIDDIDNIIIAEGTITKKVPYADVKNDILGTETLTQTGKSIKGAINEHEQDIIELNTQLSEKTNKNEVINGNFDNWQRGSNFINPASGTFTADKFRISGIISGIAPTTITHSKQAIINGELNKSTCYYRISTSDAGTINAPDTYAILHSIENGVRNLCGNGNKVTISFKARSSIIGKKLALSISQHYGSGGSPTAEEVATGLYVTLTNTWTKYTITMPTIDISNKIFGSNNDDRLKIIFRLAYGLDYAATVGDNVAENFRGSGYTDITQIKIESGEKATPFIPADLTLDLIKCMRSCELLDNMPVVMFANTMSIERSYKVRKRATPTFKITSLNGVDNKLSYWNGSVYADIDIIDTAWSNTGKIIMNITRGSLTGDILLLGNIIVDSDIY